jgi:ABC-type multidrug transport system fused ATPase/permease subunit
MGSAAITAQVRSARVRLEGLEFTYPEAATPSLSAIDLAIEPGDRIALVGRVASGKSTLGRVLCGMYRPTGGAMLVDGIDSRQYRPQDLRAAFRFVAQDSQLFSGSIKDNRRRAVPVARRGRVRPRGRRAWQPAFRRAALVPDPRPGVRQPGQADLPRRADRRDGQPDRKTVRRAVVPITDT